MELWVQNLNSSVSIQCFTKKKKMSVLILVDSLVFGSAQYEPVLFDLYRLIDINRFELQVNLSTSHLFSKIFEMCVCVHTYEVGGMKSFWPDAKCSSKKKKKKHLMFNILG